MNLRIIKEYFRPKIGRNENKNIQPGPENNILIIRLCMTLEAVSDDKRPDDVNDCINNSKWLFLRFLFQT